MLQRQHCLNLRMRLQQTHQQILGQEVEFILLQIM
uniref:Uncharacterized protein n=1 Tax=Rhizophora mucronata TaxID=61149 RepID=A0A2P2QZS8_RHIMU